MGISVITHRHLWLNLTQMSEKEKNMLLNVPVKTLGLFGPVVGSVTHKFKRQQKESVALPNLMPRWAHFPHCEPRQDPDPSHRDSFQRCSHSVSRPQSRAPQAPEAAAAPRSGMRGWSRHPSPDPAAEDLISQRGQLRVIGLSLRPYTEKKIGYTQLCASESHMASTPITHTYHCSP